MVDVMATLGVVLLAAAPLGLSVFALLDAARRPAWAWSLAQRPQAMWMAMILVGTFLSVLGVGLSLYYLVRVRPAVAGAEEGRIPPPPDARPDDGRRSG
ncbi:MAG: hypothetical protein R2754_08365 [Microthrixaceae bacterium]